MRTFHRAEVNRLEQSQIGGVLVTAGGLLSPQSIAIAMRDDRRDTAPLAEVGYH